jgi:putative membrane-bound dehydrogenase-like protein
MPHASGTPQRVAVESSVLVNWDRQRQSKPRYLQALMSRYPFLTAWLSLAWILNAWTSPPTRANTDQPVAEVPGVRLEIVVDSPRIATPTAIDVDTEGRIYVIACHTHFRPANYDGPEFDEILIFDADGSNRRVFYNRTRTTMQILLGADGWVYLAQRDRIIRIRDTDGDGVADIEEDVATLDTIADYPHNGLSGLAWHPDGDLVFALGENFGKDWTLSASDGSLATGRGEGGVFRCSPDGKLLRRIARGFWNPFGLHVRDDGIILAADNDPGDRPPCRLLHVVEGADFGFQYVYGSAPVHPFVAWNGELRGTLGMVTASGEGPCAVVELGGGVMIPSWSDRTIDYYPLHWNGATLTSERKRLVRGHQAFRPVGMACGRHGEFYIADWGSESYEVNGLGRIWKMTIDRSQADWIQSDRDPKNDTVRLAAALREGTHSLSTKELVEQIRGRDRYLSDAALAALSRSVRDWSSQQWQPLSTDERLWGLVALRRENLNDPKWVDLFWNDSNPEIRFECLRWISDAVFTQYLPQVEAMLEQPDLSYRLFEAVVAASNTLRGKPNAGITDAEPWVVRILDPMVSPTVKRYGLRLIPPSHPKLSEQFLTNLLDGMGTGVADAPDLAIEIVRSLAMTRSEGTPQALLQIATDPQRSERVRAEALAGLVGRCSPGQRQAVEALLHADAPQVRAEASRVLLDRSNLHLAKWENAAQLMQALDRLPGNPNAEAGRRVFFHTGSVSCSQCHRYDGRGGVVGPDLTLVSRQGTRDQLLQSIVEPNRDVAPQYYATLLELEDGGTFTGILLRSAGYEIYRNTSGDEVTFQKTQIAARKQLTSSLMPHGLADQMTLDELRDLLAFLAADPMKPNATETAR